MDSAPLPGGLQGFGGGGLNALEAIGDDELDAAKAPPGESAQEMPLSDCRMNHNPISQVRNGSFVT